jgi:hypothetical protein
MAQASLCRKGRALTALRRLLILGRVSASSAEPEYVVPGSRLRRFLLGPFAGPLILPLSITAVVLLFVGGRVALGAAGFLVLVGVRSSMARCSADAHGIVVTNRLVRHRIPWAEVRGVWVPGRQYRSGLFPTIRIERRGSLFFSISVYSALGLRRDRLQVACHELQSLAARSGYSVVAGSEEEVETELTKARSQDV